MDKENPSRDQLIGELAELRQQAGELRLTTERLKRSERRWRSLSEASLEAIVFIEGGIIVDANAALNRLFGYDGEDLRGRQARDFIVPERRPFTDERMRTRTPGAYETLGLRKDGTFFPIEVIPRELETNGKKLRVSAVRDLTERKSAEEALRRERDFSASIIESSPAFFVAMDGNGTVRLMNRSMLRALEYTLEEVVGRDYIETFVPASDRARLREAFAVLTTKMRPTRNENRVLAKDGRELLVEWHGRAIMTPDGKLDYFFGVGFDTTERQRMEEELRRHKDHLEELVRQRTMELEWRTIDLNDANAGLRALIKVKEEDVRELESKVLSNVRELILPSLGRLKKAVGKEHSEVVHTLEENLNSITSAFIKSMAALGLTPTEAKVATLIRDGRTIKEIADVLHISPRSVEGHRYTMRKKLQINRKKMSLQSFLRSLS